MVPGKVLRSFKSVIGETGPSGAEGYTSDRVQRHRDPSCIHEAQRLGSHGESLSRGGEGMAVTFVGLAGLQCWIKHSSKLGTRKSGIGRHGCNGDLSMNC